MFLKVMWEGMRESVALPFRFFGDQIYGNFLKKYFIKRIEHYEDYSSKLKDYLKSKPNDDEPPSDGGK